MARRRKTRAEQAYERERADRQVWNEFEPQLAALTAIDEAMMLLARAPGVDAPGRRYYSNLGFLLHQFAVPNGASARERALYAQFIQRLEAAGQLNADTAQQILQALRSQSAGNMALHDDRPRTAARG
jgi:hypothetical protein